MIGKFGWIPPRITTLAASLLLMSSAHADGDILTPEQIAYQLTQSKGLAVGGSSVDLEAVTFEFNSSTLTSQAQEQLDNLATALRFDSFDGVPFTVAGHTDAVGSEGYNQDLSERRALAVVEYLTREHDFPADAVTPVGYGESALIADASPDDGRQRRVEIKLDR